MPEFCIDFLPIHGSRSGDAIIIAFEPGTDGQEIIVVDGGFRSDGEALVEYIRDEYDSEFVDIVICSHPDEDHSAGLAPVLEELEVGMLWVHRPARHFRRVHPTQPLAEARARLLQASLNHVHTLEGLASERSVPVCEPFEGLSYAGGRLVVLGPSVRLYRQALERFSQGNRRTLDGRLERLAEAVGEELIETSENEDLRKAENTSSVVLRFQSDSGVSALLTADATQLALRRALNYSLRALGSRPLQSFDVFQVPHHGAFRNVGPWLFDSVDVASAIISASESDPQHPNDVVLDAFENSGCDVYVTGASGVRIIGYDDGTYQVERF